jgi:hypothetical protein
MRLRSFGNPQYKAAARGMAQQGNIGIPTKRPDDANQISEIVVELANIIHIARPTVMAVATSGT